MSTPEPEGEKPQQQEEKRIDVRFPLIIVRTKRFSAVFERLGKLRASRYLSWLYLVMVPFVAGIALYLIVSSLIGILSNPAAGQVVREIGPGAVLLIPGLNPILPIVYGWLAIVVAIIIHEGSHGVVARNVGFNVKSSGLLFFLFIPIGAFVDVDEEQIKKAPARPSLKVMAAGVGGNMVVGAVCLILMLVVISGVTPLVNGVYINDATAGMPAQLAGIQPKDVIYTIDGVKIDNTTQLREILDNKTAGDLIAVTVLRGDQWHDHYSTTVNLTISDNRTVMGISSYNLATQERLASYETFGIDRLAMYMVPPTLAEAFVPFSDFLAQFYSSPLGPSWSIIANTLFWLWFINFNLAIFNALPIYPLDGGRIFDITLKRFAGKRLSEKGIRRITIAATAACIILVLLVTVVPFII